MINIPATLILTLSLVFSGSTLSVADEAHLKNVAQDYLTQQSQVLSVQTAPKVSRVSTVSISDMLQAPDTPANVTPAVAPLLAPAQQETPKTATMSTNYVLATDKDFTGNQNSDFRYIGSDEYVIIPNKIKGVELRSYNSLFENTKVKGVYSTNPNIDDFGYMFMNNNSETLEFTLDTRNAVTMAGMFEGTKAKSLDLSGLDTSNVVYMHRMFRNSEAKALYLNTFNTSKVESIGSMFEGSKALTIDLSSFDTSKVRHMQHMFKDSKVKTLDLSSFSISPELSTLHLYLMFEGCEATTGYARTQADAEKFNASEGKPAGLNFTVK